MPCCVVRSLTPCAGTSWRATRRRSPIPLPCRVAALRRGRPASCVDSLSTAQTIACTGSGGVLRPTGNASRRAARARVAARRPGPRAPALRPAAHTTAGGCTFGPPKSRRSERTIALDTMTADGLRRHRDTQLLERDLAGRAYGDHDLLFCDEPGRPTHPQRLTEWFRPSPQGRGPAYGLAARPAPHGRDARTHGRSAGATARRGRRLGDDPRTILGTDAHLLAHSDELSLARGEPGLRRAGSRRRTRHSRNRQ